MYAGLLSRHPSSVAYVPKESRLLAPIRQSFNGRVSWVSTARTCSSAGRFASIQPPPTADASLTCGLLAYMQFVSSTLVTAYQVVDTSICSVVSMVDNRQLV